jgi:hypothetical protein
LPEKGDINSPIPPFLFPQVSQKALLNDRCGEIFHKKTLLKGRRVFLSLKFKVFESNIALITRATFYLYYMVI